MKVQALLLLLLVTGAAAQNETADNETGEAEGPPADGDGFDLRLAISAAAVVFLVAAFVYLAKR